MEIKVMSGDYTMLDTFAIDELLDTMLSEGLKNCIRSIRDETASSSFIIYEIEFSGGLEVTIHITDFGISVYNSRNDLSYYLIPESYNGAEEALVDRVYKMMTGWSSQNN